MFNKTLGQAQAATPKLNQKQNKNRLQEKTNETVVQLQSHPQNHKKNSKYELKQHKKQQNQFAQMEQQLKGSKFRILNELFYCSSSQDAQKHFKDNQEDYLLYHEGFRQQVQKWPQNPLDCIIQEIQDNLQKYNKAQKCFALFHKICDMGCGDGRLYEHFRDKGLISSEENSNQYTIDKIYSFDFLKTKDFIIQRDISRTGLEDESVDTCIFCLSLMGTNYLEFIFEARRILKKGGRMLVAEVSSRIANKTLFGDMIKALGFKAFKQFVAVSENGSQPEDQDKSFFTLYYFKKINPDKQIDAGDHSDEENQKVSVIANGYARISQGLRRQLNKALPRREDRIETFTELSQVLLKPCLYKKR